MIFATIISKIFEPMMVFTLIALLGGVRVGLPPFHLAIYIIVVFLMVVPVVIFRIWYMKHHGADWDLSDRKKRVRPVLVQFFLTVIYTLFVSWYFHNPQLTHIFVIFLAWIAGFALVTTQWKISGHTSTLALATGLLISWYGWHWWPILLTVPLVGWARVVRGDHTVGQVVVGAVYSWTLLELAKFVQLV